MIQPEEAVQAIAWLDMMYEESGLTPMRANEAASIIQVNKLNNCNNIYNKIILYIILYVKILYYISPNFISYYMQKYHVSPNVNMQKTEEQ